MNAPDNAARIREYFNGVTGPATAQSAQPAFVVVNHSLPDTAYFLEALSSLGTVKKVFLKPKSINQTAFNVIASRYDTSVANRAQLYDPNYTVNLIDNISGAGGSPVIAFDVGGYFSQTLKQIQDKMGARFVGVIKDTENGHQKYERVIPLESSVYSAARSPLKYCEDVLVGYSVVNATENIIRSFGDIHCPKTSSVLGYGKIGKSSAQALKSTGMSVSVYDINPVRLVQASADGFPVHRDTASALQNADIIVSCTGNSAIKGDDFSKVKSGAYISCATSADDDDGIYTKSKAGEHIDLYQGPQNHFYLLNEGNAVNFTYGASAGNYITLVHAEMLACAKEMLGKSGQSPIPPGFHEISHAKRAEIAKSWLQIFTPGR